MIDLSENARRRTEIVEEASCDLCGGAPAELAHRVPDRLMGNVFQFSKCCQCGTYFLNPRPTGAGLETNYPESYEPYRIETLSRPLPADRDTLTTLNLQLDYVERFQKRRGKLLDIGCASGSFLNHARNRGWEVIGVEPVRKAAEAGRKRYDLTIYEDLPAISPELENGFDAITLWDVLEHLPSPQAVLEKCRQLLKPGGSLFLSIPNLSSFDRRLFGTNWIGWDPPRHFYLFPRSALQDLLSRNGFSVLEYRCLSGGKGTFFMSMDTWLKDTSFSEPVKKIYPLIGLLLLPYRRLSYVMKKGPILYVAAGLDPKHQ